MKSIKLKQLNIDPNQPILMRSIKLDKAEILIVVSNAPLKDINLTKDQTVIGSMVSGKKMIKIEDQAPFLFKPGDSIILPANATVTADFPFASPSEPAVCIALIPDESLVNDAIESYNKMTKSSYKTKTKKLAYNDINFHINSEPFTQELIEMLVENINTEDDLKNILAEYTLKELIIRLLESKARNVFINETEYKGKNKLEQVIELIKKNIVNDIDIDQLASTVGISKPHFYRKFKEIYGESPLNFITNQRISISKKLLLDSNLSLEDVSVNSGFKSTSYFTKRFKSRELKTPIQYRKDLASKLKKSLNN